MPLFLFELDSHLSWRNTLRSHSLSSPSTTLPYICRRTKYRRTVAEFRYSSALRCVSDHPRWKEVHLFPGTLPGGFTPQGIARLHHRVCIRVCKRARERHATAAPDQVCCYQCSAMHRVSHGAGLRDVESISLACEHHPPGPVHGVEQCRAYRSLNRRSIEHRTSSR